MVFENHVVLVAVFAGQQRQALAKAVALMLVCSFRAALPWSIA